MKKTSLIFCAAFIMASSTFAQYIGVRARYTDSRLVANPPFPDSRENRLQLSFYDVSAAGVWTPATLVNFDIWVHAFGPLVEAEFSVLDSAGANYEGYSWTAPKVAAYYNSLGPNFFDCDPNAGSYYNVNGQTLDCGYFPVSYWEEESPGGPWREIFVTMEVNLPFYFWPDPLAILPGNVNFGPLGILGSPPYNLYNFSCSGPLQLVTRGTLPSDSAGSFFPLPVTLSNFNGTLDQAGWATLTWSNLTESSISVYEVQSSADGNSYQTIRHLIPTNNGGDRADYLCKIFQQEEKAYYRIKVIENGGDQVYSKVISITKPIVSVQQIFSVYPNPVSGNNTFTFNLTNAVQGRYISYIITPDGGQINQKMIDHGGGDLTRQVDLTGLPPGIYNIVLRSAGQKFSQKLVYIQD